MKRWIAVGTVAGVSSLLLLFGIIMRDVAHQQWNNYTPGKIRDIAIAVYAFRDQEDSYPETLSALQALPARFKVEELLTNTGGRQYSYRVVSNGFIIVATRSAGVFSRPERMERFFESGGVPGDYGRPTPGEAGTATNHVLHIR